VSFERYFPSVGERVVVQVGRKRNTLGVGTVEAIDNDDSVYSSWSRVRVRMSARSVYSFITEDDGLSYHSRAKTVQGNITLRPAPPVPSPAPDYRAIAERLAAYCEHVSHCKTWFFYNIGSPEKMDKRCTCGLVEALEALRVAGSTT